MIWELSGPDIIPFAGVCHGRNEVDGFFSSVVENADIEAFEIDPIVSDGETVVVFGHERFMVKTTGRHWDVNWAHVHTVKNGHICRFREYTDTAAIAADFSELPINGLLMRESADIERSFPDRGKS